MFFTNLKFKMAVKEEKPKVPSRPFTSTYTVKNTKSYQLISFQKNASSEINDSNSSERNVSYYGTNFVQLATIGEGSFSEVYKAVSNEDGKMYAIKKTKLPYRSASYRKRCHDEARYAEMLSECDHCVTFYKAWEQSGYLYLQLELCETLEEYTRSLDKIPVDFYWKILTDMLLAIKALHDRDLIHTDIKLDNILIDANNVCKLSDFGLVISTTEKTRKDFEEGDNRYIAPETLNNNFTKALDIFSLGITMLELVTNIVLPTDGDDWHLLRKGRIPTELKKLIPDELGTIIESMIAMLPNDRPEVDTLLSWPRIKIELNKRNKPAIFVPTSTATTWKNNGFEAHFDYSDTDSPTKIFVASPINGSSMNSKIVNSTPVNCSKRSRSDYLNSSFGSPQSSFSQSVSLTRKRLNFAN